MSYADERPSRGLDAGEETAMNMTPMIDIVFQLIIFFLLSLKFKTVDERIDTRLPPVGIGPGPAPLDEAPKIKLKLFRRNTGEPTAYTLLKVDGSHQFRLPQSPERHALQAGERETAQSDRRAAYDAVRTRLLAVISAKWSAVGRDPDLFAEIVTPPPHGGSVPHGDCIFALDTLVEAGIGDVRFEGTAPPLNSGKHPMR